MLPFSNIYTKKINVGTNKHKPSYCTLLYVSMADEYITFFFFVFFLFFEDDGLNLLETNLIKRKFSYPID